MEIVVNLEAIGIIAGLTLLTAGVMTILFNDDVKPYATGWAVTALGVVITVVSILVLIARSVTTHIGVG